MERTEGSSSQVERPHFFKIILSHDNKLALPQKFVQTYGDFLSSPVILKVPAGLKWEVELVKSNGHVWFQNGWPNFADYYSITPGTFIVFEFVKRNCEFNVTLFDKSCTEIDYPLKFDQQFRDGDPVKARRINRGKNEEKGNIIHRASSSFQSRIPSFMIVMQKSNVSRRSILVIPPSFARKHLNKSGDAIFSFSDGRTWHVKYCTKTTFEYPKTRVEHLGWSKFANDIFLRVGDVCVFELIDNAKTIFRVIKNGNTSSCCPKLPEIEQTRACLTQSSILRKRKQESSFSFSQRGKKANKVENIIEITGKDLGSMKRSMGNKSSNRKSNQKPSFLYRPGAAKIFTSENRCFQVAMTANHLRSGSVVHVPCKFTKNLEKAKQEVKLQVGNRVWSANLSNYPECGKNLLSGGWINFARENCLKEGDVCSFELIDTQKMLIKVSISRNTFTNRA